MEVVVIKVYRENLDSEFDQILRFLPRFPFVSMDTEFPGTVYNPDVPAYLRSTLSPTEFYKVMKKNVDSLKLIQLGLTLSDAYGNLPTAVGTRTQVVWEFNFSDFDCETDRHNEESIALLQRQGIDFEWNKKHGINSSHFADLFLEKWPRPKKHRNKILWVTFHGPYDLGFLIKVLTGGEPLPAGVDGFFKEVERYFGPEVYDVKMMIPHFGLHGGLDRVAKSLNVNRVVGESHQAGSDSLLTMDVFLKLRKRSLCDEKMRIKMWDLKNKVYGLTTQS